MAQCEKRFEYRVVEKFDGTFLCAVWKDGQLYGPINEFNTHEQVFAWQRLVMGSYPGTGTMEKAA